MKKNRIDIFLENNKEVQLDERGEKIILLKCWDDKSFHFEFEKKENMSFIESLVFPKDLSAIYHKDKGLYEFIFLPLPQKYARSFEYVYQGKKFKLYYGKPTNIFEKLKTISSNK